MSKVYDNGRYVTGLFKEKSLWSAASFISEIRDTT